MSSLSSIVHQHGLPPLPRSLAEGVATFASPHPQHHLQQQQQQQYINHGSHSQRLYNEANDPNRPPIPPPRPHPRRSSSSPGSNLPQSSHNSGQQHRGISCSPNKSLSSNSCGSPHGGSPYYFDSGLGPSSADSYIFNSSSEEAIANLNNGGGGGAVGGIHRKRGNRVGVRANKEPPPRPPSAPNNLNVQPLLDEKTILMEQLKLDMEQLRQNDISLLGHLLQIHKGIQDLRFVLVQPPPDPAPPSPSSGMLPMFQQYSSPQGGSNGIYSNNYRGGEGSSSSSSGGGSRLNKKLMSNKATRLLLFPSSRRSSSSSSTTSDNNHFKSPYGGASGPPPHQRASTSGLGLYDDHLLVQQRHSTPPSAYEYGNV